MELPMTDNPAIAVAAAGGAAAQDQDIPEAVLTVPEVWKLRFTLPWRLTPTDAALFGSVILVAAYVLADIVPQSTGIGQSWLFFKLLLVLIAVYGGLGVLGSLWDKMCRSRSAGSPEPRIRPQELKRELVKRWIEDLPNEEEKKEEDDIIDPVGDGIPLGEPDIEIKDSKSIIGEVLAHHISLEEKRAQITQPIDSTLVNAKPEHRITESRCPGGDVAWTNIPVKESWSQERRKEIEFPLHPIPVITTTVHDTTNVSPSQEGLNFDETPGSTESTTSVEENPGDVIRVFSKGVLSDYSTSQKDESETVNVDEDWRGAVGPNEMTSSTIDPVGEDFSDVRDYIPVARPPSQPAGVSSAFSVTQAFLLERNALDDEEYARLDKMSALQDRSVYSQADLRDHHGGYSGCPHRHCCRNHAELAQGIDHKDQCFGTGSGNVDLLDESRPMPGSYFGAPRSMCDTDHANKFHLTVIPEDDLPQSV